jgi:hypothetical protein
MKESRKALVENAAWYTEAHFLMAWLPLKHHGVGLQSMACVGLTARQSLSRSNGPKKLANYSRPWYTGNSTSPLPHG